MVKLSIGSCGFMLHLFATICSAKKLSNGWSYSTCSSSLSKSKRLNFNCTICSKVVDFSVKVTVIPSDPTAPHEFETRGLEIGNSNNNNIAVNMTRKDRDTGWNSLPITVIVEESGYEVSEYIALNAQSHFNVDEGRYKLSTGPGDNNKITTLINQGILNVSAVAGTNPPRLSNLTRNGRKYIEFNSEPTALTVGVNINQQNSLSVLVVYRNGGFNRTQHNRDWLRSCLFGNLLDEGLLICFTKNNNLTVLRINNWSPDIRINNFPKNAVANAIGVWNVLTVQWEYGGTGVKSSVWCNGIYLRDFVSVGTLGSNSFSIGDATQKSNSVPFNGAIGEFVMYQNHTLSDNAIKVHHKYFMDKWAIGST